MMHEIPEQHTYEPPVMIVYGNVIQLTHGPDGNESDGCSSGRYENDTDEE